MEIKNIDKFPISLHPVKIGYREEDSLSCWAHVDTVIIRINTDTGIAGLGEDVTIIDEYTRECLAILTQRRITSQDVIEQLFYLFMFGGTPEYIRSDNGPEFTLKAVRRWLSNLEVTTIFIEAGSPWENRYIESFNGKLRDELLNREVFTTPTEAKILIEEWREKYN